LPEETYPEDLRYHPEHDWARIEGDEATFGITWYAQDALGEVVFFEPPEVGTEVSKDQAYAEVESVKGRFRRLRAALGRGDHGQQGARRQPPSRSTRLLQAGLASTGP
jgi:hypothetical protein